MMTVPKNLRLGGLVLAFGLLAGCSLVDRMEPDLQDLEVLGLESVQTTNDYFLSLYALHSMMSDGNAFVADLLVRNGLVIDIPASIEEVNRHRSDDQTADHNRVIEILEAADPVSATRQMNLEARQLALDEALSEVPNGYVGIATRACYSIAPDGVLHPLPVYLIAQCVESNFDYYASWIEPRGAHEQFGVWVDMWNNNYLVIAEASGGAAICKGSHSASGQLTRTAEKHLGSFNDEGALIVSAQENTLTLTVRKQNGTDYLDYAYDSFSRATGIMHEGIARGIRDCDNWLSQ